MHKLKKISTFSFVLYVFGLLLAIGPAAMFCAGDIRVGPDDKSMSRGVPMRKLIVFVFAFAMLGFGLYWVIGELLWSPPIAGHRGYATILLAGVFPAFLGAYLLWVDFIAPALGIKTGEEPPETRRR